jgi:hypothetical protein
MVGLFEGNELDKVGESNDIISDVETCIAFIVTTRSRLARNPAEGNA